VPARAETFSLSRMSARIDRYITMICSEKDASHTLCVPRRELDLPSDLYNLAVLHNVTHWIY